MGKRLRDVCGLPEDEELWKIGRGFVTATCLDAGEAAPHPAFEFENWAVIQLGGIANKSKVGDMGIDGRIFPSAPNPRRPRTTNCNCTSGGIHPGEAKGQGGPPDIDSFETAMRRSRREKGFFVAFDYSETPCGR